MNFDSIPEWVAVLGTVLTTLALTVGLVNRWIVQPLKRSQDAKIEAAMKPVLDKLDDINHELTANSGTTLRDKVVNGFAEQGERIGRLEGTVEVLSTIIAER